MKSFFVKASHRITAFAIAIALAGVFTSITAETAQAATQSPCATWLRVIDLSSNDIHPMDWTKMVKAGVAGAYIKSTEAANYVNPYFTKDAAAASKAGIPWGSYHFAQPGKVDAVTSAKYFVANGGAKGQLPPALDLEVTKLGPAQTAQWALTWLQSVQALSGRKPIIYVGFYFPASQYGFLAPYDLWLPAYSAGYSKDPKVCSIARPRVPNPWVSTGWKLWQYTSMAYINGKHGRSDYSVAESSWFTKWTGAGYQPNDNPNKPAAPLYSDGSHGTKVLEIQRLLISKNLLPKGSDDGVFGVQTKRALEKWQITIGVKGDGVWSVDTQAASDFYIKNGHTLVQDALWKGMGQKMKDNAPNIKL